ncbi:hypothetical protein IQ241_03305 [Romeria aff. gracilis LEGE 07310]|uniref:Glycosyl hydrolase n=1 Tax=Vasconcelosia minhoensis LEGE 07310 TaxID=915328 RepID=A0A8J7AVG1_9CYAN|nr:hypothetical protein [Romeria gracilis]MBE9076332.1 hypothetical protein [Romeria aff. gracilis LEGE 07310]
MQTVLATWIQRYKFLLMLLITVLFACNASLPSQSKFLTEPAKSANSFVDSAGVVVHLNYRNSAYKNYNNVIKPRLQELGIRHIRDGVTIEDTATQQKFIGLASVGIKSTLVMDPRDQPKASLAVDIAKAMPTSVEAVEGPNEWDVWDDLTYKERPFPEGVRIFQAELYDSIKGDLATAELDVLSPTVAYWNNANQLGEVDCDYGAMHSYAGGNPPGTDLEQHWIPSAKLICPAKPVIATESGWHNAISSTYGQPGVSEDAAGKYVPRLFLEYFNRGIRRAYINELINRYQNSGMEGNFGLLRWDGSPKPAFIALKNFIALIRDDVEGEFSPSALSYSISGGNSDVHHTLLQKHNGNFYLILWQEVRSFNLSSKRDILVTAQPVTVNLASTIRHGKLYYPLQSTTPEAEYTNPTSIDLEVSDAPLILELSPSTS